MRVILKYKTHNPTLYWSLVWIPQWDGPLEWLGKPKRDVRENEDRVLYFY